MLSGAMLRIHPGVSIAKQSKLNESLQKVPVKDLKSRVLVQGPPMNALSMAKVAAGLMITAAMERCVVGCLTGSAIMTLA